MPRPPKSKSKPKPKPPTNPPTHWSTLLASTSLSTLPSATKSQLLSQVATDITTAVIRIAHHLETGALDPQHTVPIKDMMAVITGVEARHRRDLERRVRKMEAREKRRRRRWKGERVWMRDSFEGVLIKATEVSERWKERVRVLEERERERSRGLGLGWEIGGGVGMEKRKGREL